MPISGETLPNFDNTAKTAAIIAIGDELLSGRTVDKNIAHLAKLLTIKGIQLAQARIIADDEATIITTINSLRTRYDYLFTSGGIGPTHDDITSAAVAKAFGVAIEKNTCAFQMLEKFYRQRELPFTNARQKMARIPVGAKLIENSVSTAPGFQLENVFIMAGVPAVFNAMVLAIEPQLATGIKLHEASIDCPLGEGTIGDELAQIARNFPTVSIGSYPRFDENHYTTQIVLRAPDEVALSSARDEIFKMLNSHQPT